TETQTASEWRWTLTDSDGVVLGNGTTKRRPSAAQRRFVEARTPTCLFPGCRAPATQCEIDHNHPWALGGPTNPENEGPLCRHDNVGKEHGWRLRRLRPGIYQWTSPLGHTYIAEGRRPP
ncbi:MAG: HNH endonuclease signature motif containing protein, partial [Acidimicrobiia bacterium]